MDKYIFAFIQLYVSQQDTLTDCEIHELESYMI